MNRICVIGGANVDLCGASLEPLVDYDSNPGKIAMSYGGVGRNIAQILALLGRSPLFVTCFSGDIYGKHMRQDCESLGMDCRYCRTVEDMPSSMYLAILDEHHDMRIAMSDMRILSCMDTAMIDEALASLDENDLLTVDANLSVDILEYILDHAPCPTAADPVSVCKAPRLKPVLSKISIFKPNQFEAASLSGIKPADEASAVKCLSWFESLGMKEIIISMADRGILLSAEGNRYWMKHRRIEIENATGGGDAFMGAYLSRRLMGEEPLPAAEYACTAAVMTIEHDAVRRRTLNDAEICSQIKNMEIEEKRI